MEIVKMRDLLRDPAGVFALLEQDEGAVVLTRNGTPIATLTRIDKESAASAILPDFNDRRARAVRAQAEGQMISADEVLMRRPASSQEAEPEEGPRLDLVGGRSETGEPDQLLRLITAVLGTDATELADQLEARVDEASGPVVQVVTAADHSQAGSDTSAEIVAHVRNLNRGLFSRYFFRTYLNRVAELLPHLEELDTKGEAIDPAGLNKELQVEVLDEITSRIRTLNASVVTKSFGGDPLDVRQYEAFVLGVEQDLEVAL